MTATKARSMIPLRAVVPRRLNQPLFRRSFANSSCLRTQDNDSSKTSYPWEQPPKSNTANFPSPTPPKSQYGRKAILATELMRPHARRPARPLSEGLKDLIAEAGNQDTRSGSRTAQRQEGLIAQNMDLGRDIGQIVGNSNASLSVLAAPLRLDAFIGRSEPVLSQGGLASAIRKLDIKLAYNQVRKEERKQKFHERPGLKRKRLSSERWRARFKTGFLATVKKVQKMRNQGW